MKIKTKRDYVIESFALPPEKRTDVILTCSRLGLARSEFYRLAVAKELERLQEKKTHEAVQL
jgi:hypothetical protein